MRTRMHGSGTEQGPAEMRQGSGAVETQTEQRGRGTGGCPAGHTVDAVGDADGGKCDRDSGQEVPGRVKDRGGRICGIHIVSGSIGDGNLHTVFGQGLRNILSLRQGETLGNLNGSSAQKIACLGGSITEDFFQKRKRVSDAAASTADQDDFELRRGRILGRRIIGNGVDIRSQSSFRNGCNIQLMAAAGAKAHI